MADYGGGGYRPRSNQRFAEALAMSQRRSRAMRDDPAAKARRNQADMIRFGSTAMSAIPVVGPAFGAAGNQLADMRTRDDEERLAEDDARMQQLMMLLSALG